jgi:hypothetical protein
MSNTTVPVPVVAPDRAHTAERTSAIASLRPTRVAGEIWWNVRHSVESDGTAPNNTGWARRCSMSAHDSPPPASINMAWVSTLPRSCNGRRSPLAGMRADRQSPTPRRSAKAPSACRPTWAATWSPPVSTSTGTVVLPFTSQVPSSLGTMTPQQRQNPLPGGLLRGWAHLRPSALLNDRG